MAAMATLDPKLQRQFALDVVTKLREALFEAYWAGGCVRDRLLSQTPKDYDVATDATPEETRQVFGERRTLAVGAAFGVIVVLGPQGAGQIDVATFREDAGYSDGRRPDAVIFSTPQLDALRRDFTINGLFFDPLREQVIDYVGGQADLAAGIVRAIGEPRERFAEDKLRMLRAVRFAAAFGFDLEPETAAAIGEMASQVTVVSPERIAAEMSRMLVHESRARAVRLLAEAGLLAVVLPELPPLKTEPTRDDYGWRETLLALERLVEPTFPLALAALLCGFVNDFHAVQPIVRRWKLSNRDAEQCCWLVAHTGALAGARTANWPRLQRLLAGELAEDLLALDEARAVAAGASLDDIAWCREIVARPRHEWDPPPLISGDDLLALGIPPGKVYQYLLEQVRDAQLEARVATPAEAIALARSLYDAGSGNR